MSYQSSTDAAQRRAEALRDQLKDDVAGELRTSTRHRWWRRLLLRGLGCLGLSLLSIAVVPLTLLFLAAKTGLVDVPVLSGMVEHARTPVRVVAPKSVALEALLEARLREAMRRTGRPPEVLEVPITERELTGLLRAAFQGDQAIPRLATTAQVAVDPGVVELYGIVEGWRGSPASVLLRAAPTIDGGRVVPNVQSVAIGGLAFPKFLVRFASNAIARRLPAAEFPLEAGGPKISFDRIDLAQGSATLRLRFAPPAR